MIRDGPRKLSTRDPLVLEIRLKWIPPVLGLDNSLVIDDSELGEGDRQSKIPLPLVITTCNDSDTVTQSLHRSIEAEKLFSCSFASHSRFWTRILSFSTSLILVQFRTISSVSAATSYQNRDVVSRSPSKLCAREPPPSPSLTVKRVAQL